MNKVTTIENAMSRIKSGSSIMVGGFLKCGHPQMLTGFLSESKADNLTIISMCTGTTECNLYKVFLNKQVSCVKASYIGFNPETQRLMLTKEADVELMPMGTLTERIRAGGSGLGGILTPAGVGTIVEEGKQKITVNGKEFLLELPLRADFALVHAYMADEMGNLVFRGTARNFNAIMPYAADYVIAEVENIVKTGDISPDDVIVPGAFVDAVVKVGE